MNDQQSFVSHRKLKYINERQVPLNFGLSNLIIDEIYMKKNFFWKDFLIFYTN